MKLLIQCLRITSVIAVTAVFFSLSLLSQGKEPVVMIFAGDVVLSDHVEAFVKGRTEYVFELWKPGKESDIFMVNLEHPVTMATDRVEKKYNFKMNPVYGATLVDAGITIVNAANNHIFDYGLQGMEDTMKFLDSLEIAYVGLGRNLAQARKPVVMRRKGWAVGFLGYYGGGEFSAGKNTPGFAPRYARFMVEDIRDLKKKADYVVVNLHWGTERAPEPEGWQIQLAHRLVDAGADLIVGHHPHVLQGIEKYKGATIAFSLGNFVFGGNTRHTYDTAVLKVTISGAAPVVELVPVTVTRWQPRPSSPPATREVLELVRERSANLHHHPFFSGAQE
jgi:poly-gamma-glutamate capsule biosynthesis protein CapA/YwtB (metallophosphatase superfamily)